MRTTYLPHCAVILTTTLAGSCAYTVVDSADACRFESERVLGYTMWTDIDCTEEKDEKAESLRDKVDDSSTR